LESVRRNPNPNNRLTLAIGGLAIQIRAANTLPWLRSDNLESFQIAARRADITWTYLTVNPLPGSPRIKALLHHAREHAERYAVEANAQAVTILDFKKKRADIYISPEFAPEAASRRIGPAMLAPFLPGFEACLLHASAVVRGGRTAVFLAPDEGGKTTAALLSPEGAILSDDQVLVRRFPEGFRVAGTPWGLHFDAKLQAPLSGFYLLEKGRDFSLTPLSARALVPYIWEEARDSLSILPTAQKKKAFTLICAMAASVQAWKLSFAKGYIDWQAIDETLTG